MHVPYEARIQASVARCCEGNGSRLAELYVIKELALHHGQLARIIDRTYHANACWDVPWAVTRPTVENAVDLLLDKGVATMITAAFSREIERAVADSQLELGPTDGLPCIGDLDLTLRGAAYLRDLDYAMGLDPDRRDLVVRLDGMHGASWLVGTDKSELLKVAKESIVPHEGVRIVGRPRELGFWTDRWWRRFERGWRLALAPSEGRVPLPRTGKKP